MLRTLQHYVVDCGSCHKPAGPCAISKDQAEAQARKAGYRDDLVWGHLCPACARPSTPGKGIDLPSGMHFTGD